MENCFFCKSIAGREHLDFIELDLSDFVAAWDASPVTPGHALVIPKRHAQGMSDLNEVEQMSLIPAVLRLKEFILNTDLRELNERLDAKYMGSEAERYFKRAIENLKHRAGPPDAFNDGLNDGAAAGQTVMHFHWHVMPRWAGDSPEPRGGVRHIFKDLGNYSFRADRR